MPDAEPETHWLNNAMGRWAWGLGLLAILAGCARSDTAVPPLLPTSTPHDPDDQPRYMVFESVVPGAGWEYAGNLDPPPFEGRDLGRWCSKFRKGADLDQETPLILMCGYDKKGLPSYPPGPDTTVGEINDRKASWILADAGSPLWGSVEIHLTQRWTVGLTTKFIGLQEGLEYARKLRPASESEWRATYPG